VAGGQSAPTPRAKVTAVEMGEFTFSFQGSTTSVYPLWLDAITAASSSDGESARNATLRVTPLEGKLDAVIEVEPALRQHLDAGSGRGEADRGADLGADRLGHRRCHRQEHHQRPGRGHTVRRRIRQVHPRPAPSRCRGSGAGIASTSASGSRSPSGIRSPILRPSSSTGCPARKARPEPGPPTARRTTSAVDHPPAPPDTGASRG